MLRIIIKKIVIIPLLCGLLWFGGFLIFVASLPIEPEDTQTPTDAIVVWTGGPHRLTTGVELLRQGLAQKLLISGVSPTLSSKKALIQKICPNINCEKELLDRVTLGYAAKTTIGNAVETADWVASNKVRSIRLVTTAMHIPRSNLEIRRYLPDCQLIYHPVALSYFDHRLWWKDLNVFIKIAREYSKYLVVALGGSSSIHEKLEEMKEDL